MAYFWIFIGGGAGSMARYALSWHFNKLEAWPWGTLLANSLSCILLGILTALLSRQLLSIEMRLLLITGFCGGFSTFSTFSNDILQMWKLNQQGMALAYMTISLLSGVAALVLGMKLANG
ncbi:MAG: fluoride efflux transporter CrcB [Saprospiraceae bacterium]